jgi:deubiquitinase DESI2
VIRGKEYAYGGHNKRNTTGVYWTKPQFEPPGGTFRQSILQGFTFRSEKEIEAIVKQVSDEFLGTNYNLLTNNCNHFTNALCEKLTNKPAPGWLNRAASIGLALPCMVPKEWVQPPDFDTADGELLDEEDEGDEEHSAMLASEQRRRHREAQRAGSLEGVDEEAGSSLAGGRRLFSKDETPPPRLVSVKDTSGREMPVAERAPVPKKT